MERRKIRKPWRHSHLVRSLHICEDHTRCLCHQLIPLELDYPLYLSIPIYPASIDPYCCPSCSPGNHMVTMITMVSRTYGVPELEDDSPDGDPWDTYSNVNRLCTPSSSHR
eukprot:sb/3477168/